MVRVLFVEASSGFGGGQLALYTLLKSVNRETIEPIVASLKDGHLHGQIERLSMDTYLIPVGSLVNPLNWIIGVCRLASLVEKTQPRVIVSNDYGGHLFAGVVAHIRQIPVIWWVHGVTRPSLSKTWVAQRVIAAIPASKIVANSVWTKDQLRKLYGLHCSVVYPGIDVNRLVLSANGGAVRNEFSVPANQLVATTIGRLCSFKGQHIFLEAASLVLQRHPNARFMIVGGTSANIEPDYPEFLRRRARKLGIATQVIMTGFRENVADFYAASDVIVHAATEVEAFGLTILEAMAFAKPVIATRTGGPEEIVEHGRTGFLVEPNNPQILAKYLNLLFEDARLRKAMGKAGAERAAHVFSAERFVRKFEELLTDLAQARR